VDENGYYQLTQQADGSNYSLSMLSVYAYYSGLTTDPAVGTDLRSPAPPL